jgi:hypothetical protein
MPEQTVSVTTYTDPEPITVPKADGGKGATPIVPSWGDRPETKRDLLAETQRLVRRDIPVETLEGELRKLIGVMNRIFSQAEQTAEDQVAGEPPTPQKFDRKRLQLNEVSVAVEITAEGGLSILGSGGKFGGKGGITLKFARG